MAEAQSKTKQGDTCLTGYIDLLVENGLVKKDDVALLKEKYTTCEQLYEALESLGVLDLKKLIELFAKSKGIAYIDVKTIDQRAYEMIDKELVKSFSFIPFAISDKEKVLQVAIADPVKLSKVSQGSLKAIEKKIGYKIELFLTSKSVIDDLPLLVKEGGEFPEVDLSSYWIDESILRKIPYDLALKYKVIIFKQIGSREYNVAVANVSDRSILLMLDQMEEKAGIKFNIFSAPASQLDKILRDYKDRNNQRAKQAEEDRKERERVAKEIEEERKKVEEEKLKAKEEEERIKKEEAEKARLEQLKREEERSKAEQEKERIEKERARKAQIEQQKLEEERLKAETEKENAKQAVIRKAQAEQRKLEEQENSEQKRIKEAVKAAPAPKVQEEESAQKKSIFDFEVKLPGTNDETTRDSSRPLVEQKSEGEKQVDKFEDPDISKIIGGEKPTVELVKNFASKGNIPQLLASVIATAINQQASDIHIEPFEKAVRLRYRVDGGLADVAQFPPQIQPQIVARVKILSKLKLDEQRVPQDGRFDVTFGKEVVDIRVSTLPTVFGEKVVLRLLSKTRKLNDLPDLGLEGINFDRVIEAIAKPYGVVLATGPTGSGKSTTLYSVFTRLNKPEVNIITLEDPVEYEIPGINQVQVKPQIGFSFAEGLRSVLRQDPNIIMVGEIRDGETAELAVQAALTGHLVFSTLHTNDAASALPRMYNLGVEPFLLTSAINAVIGQRLVRRICSKCKQEVTLPQSISFQVKKELDSLNLNIPIKFYKGKGCNECREGYKGRLGIYEVLSMSKQLENQVLDKKTAGEIFTQAVKEGMITMKQDGLIKAIKGATTVDEVLRVTREQNKEG